jgi:hypothetical protein
VRPAYIHSGDLSLEASQEPRPSKNEGRGTQNSNTKAGPPVPKTGVDAVIKRLILVTIATTIFIRPVGSAPTRLLGCEDPAVLSHALRGFSDSDWNEISEVSLRSKWPSELTTANCIPGSCQMIWREDRVIGGKCECCESFDFEAIHETNDVAVKKQLSNIVIHYSTDSSAEIYSVAKIFARALGFSEADVATIHGDALLQFDREVTVGKRKEVALMSIQVAHQNST